MLGYFLTFRLALEYKLFFYGDPIDDHLRISCNQVLLILMDDNLMLEQIVFVFGGKEAHSNVIWMFHSESRCGRCTHLDKLIESILCILLMSASLIHSSD